MAQPGDDPWEALGMRILSNLALGGQPSTLGDESEPKPAPAAPMGPVSAAPTTPPKAAYAIAGPTFGDRVYNFGRALQGAEVPNADRQTEAKNRTFAALVSKGVSPDIAKAAVMNPDMMKGLIAQHFGGKGTFGVNPMYGVDEKGDPVALQLNSRGEASIPTLPPGVKLTPPGLKTVDTGTGTAIVGRGGNVQSVIGKDVEEEARRKKLGTERGEEQAGINKDRASLEGSASALKQLRDTATAVHDHAGLPGNFGISGKFPNMPGGDAAGANAKLIELKSKVGFAVLQAMREASKTGGALGSVTEGEHKLLQNAMGALDSAQSVEQVQAELRNIIDLTRDSESRLSRAFEDKHGLGSSARRGGGGGWSIQRAD